jgi:hypothetical protein
MYGDGNLPDHFTAMVTYQTRVGMLAAVAAVATICNSCCAECKWKWVGVNGNTARVQNPMRFLYVTTS